MAFIKLRFCVMAYILFKIAIYCQTEEEIRSQIKLPTVTIAILVRNKAHILPYFLSAIDQLDYPKDRINMWIYSDYNSDNSIEILREWQKYWGSQYNKFYLKTDDTTPMYYPDEYRNVTSWTPKRRRHVISLRELGFKFARSTWSDYLFMLDADVILTDPETLKSLIWLSGSLVTSPMLQSEGLYSNFWHDMSKEYSYRRTKEYPAILKREKELTGCHDVPMVHTAVLVSLKHKDSDKLTFDPEKIAEYEGPIDDTVALSVSSSKVGSKLKLCNLRPYGYITMPTLESSREQELQKLLNIKLKALSKGIVFPLSRIVAKYVSYPEPSKLTMCNIYMINLARRTERRYLMSQNFKELGMEVDIYDAVDGKKLTKEDLDKLEIETMPEFLDPYTSRSMTAGEIGCFLSHYNIWNEIIKKGYNLTMVLEDDIEFAPYFREKLARVLKEAKGYNYDLLYLGRKILSDSGETKITKHTVRPTYSYWTLGYILSFQGAWKLLKANPLKNLLPVDEYLPIMYNSHPNEVWREKFPKHLRNLRVLSADPLLMHPTHYTGMEGYISDTEDSVIMNEAYDIHSEL